MASEYSALITLLLVAVLLPGWALVGFLRPRRIKDFLRGGESAICLALALDSTRRLLLIAAGNQIPFPEDLRIAGRVITQGSGIAIINVALLGVIAVLVWGRLSQVLRHRARNKIMASPAWMRSQGIDPQEIERLRKEQGEKK